MYDFRVPHTVVTDLGPEFVSKMQNILFDSLNIDRKVTKGCQPRCNGAVEQFNNNIKAQMQQQGLTGRAPVWDVCQHHNHCDTIAYSDTGRAHPSTREARGTGGGRSSSRGTATTPLHTAPKFLPEKGREAGRTRCGGKESELIHMIERIYIKKTSAFIPPTRLRR
jgi:hypothetical protein